METAKLIAKLAIAHAIANYIGAVYTDTGRILKISDAVKTLTNSDEIERLVYEDIVSRLLTSENRVLNP